MLLLPIPGTSVYVQNSTHDEYLQTLDSLIQCPASSSALKISIESHNQIDFFSQPVSIPSETEKNSDEGNDVKETKHLMICPHKDRKHYAKVKITQNLRECVATATIGLGGKRKPGYVHTLINQTIRRENVKLAIFSIITMYYLKKTNRPKKY